MRRAILALGGTIAGLALLLSFKSHGTTPGATAATGTPGTSSPSGPGGSANVAGSSPGGGSASTGGGATGGGTGPGGSPGTRTVTGAVDTTQYGPMQIALTLSGQKITKVTVLQRTDTGSESNQIDSFAIPKLTSETLAAQSAKIDAVSGATYTSAGYIKSLQSAVDKARA
jgi:FMN-binding domain